MTSFKNRKLKLLVIELVWKIITKKERKQTPEGFLVKAYSCHGSTRAYGVYVMSNFKGENTFFFCFVFAAFEGK